MFARLEASVPSVVRKRTAELSETRSGIFACKQTSLQTVIDDIR